MDADRSQRVADEHENGSQESDPLAVLGEQLKALLAYAQHYIAAKKDGLQVALRNLAIVAVLGLVGVTVVIAAAVIGTIHLYQGVAAGLARLFEAAWLGDLLAGVLGLGGMGVAALCGLTWLRGRSLKGKKREYEARKDLQRQSFGEDTEHWARNPV